MPVVRNKDGKRTTVGEKWDVGIQQKKKFPRKLVVIDASDQSHHFSLGHGSDAPSE